MKYHNLKIELSTYFKDKELYFGWYSILGELKNIEEKYKSEIVELKKEISFLKTIQDIHLYLNEYSEETISLLKLKFKFEDEYLQFLKEKLPHFEFVYFMEVKDGFNDYIKKNKINTDLEVGKVRHEFIEKFEK